MPRLLFLLLLAYGVFLLVLYAVQRRMMYFPTRERLGAPAAHGLPELKALEVRTEDGLTLTSWFAPPAEKNGRVVVMFHGNGGSIADRPLKARLFLEKGFGLLMCEYRGYGGNPGSPSEQGFYEDARANFKWLAAQGYKSSQIVIYGESIGTGVAVQMALETGAPWLILEAPFSSTIDIARQKYFYVPLDLLMLDTFDNYSKIARISAALLILHGDKDETIPLRFAQKLFAAAREPKKFVLLKGAGHTDLYDFRAGEAILEWLRLPAANENRPGT